MMLVHSSVRAGVVLAAAAFTLACDGSGVVPGGDTPAAAGPSHTPMQRFVAGDLVVEQVAAAAPVAPEAAVPPVAVYFQVRNTGTDADTLDAVEVPGAMATLHQQTDSGTGMETMVPLAFAVIPPGDAMHFAPGGRHVMVEGLARAPSPGDRIPLTLLFRRGAPVRVEARVVSYAELEDVVSAGAAAHEGH